MAATSRSTETTESRCSSSTASRARGLEPPTGTGMPPDVTSSGPRIPNSTAVPTPDDAPTGCNRPATRRSESNAMDPEAGRHPSPPAATRSDISAIAYGFMASKALFAALEIGVFTVLADGPLAPVDLADRTGLAVGRLRTLLHALAGLGLLVRDGDTFGNAPAADRYLVRGRAEDFGDYFRLQLGRQIYPALLHLDAGIAGTGRAFDTMSALLSAPDDARTFTTAQHVGSLAAARVLADRVLPDRLPTGSPGTGVIRLLDVGGGSGAFSIALCRRFPTLRATILDFPTVVEIARDYRDEAGHAGPDRVGRR